MRLGGNLGLDGGSAGMDLSTQPGLTWGAAGAVTGNTAANVNGTSTGLGATTTAIAGPDTFSVEAWFKTTTTTGGKIVGFGNSTAGTSNNYDRHIYMSNSGQLTFGVYTGGTRTITTSTAYNDGQWHHVVGTLGAAGMTLLRRRAPRRQGHERDESASPTPATGSSVVTASAAGRPSRPASTSTGRSTRSRSTAPR